MDAACSVAFIFHFLYMQLRVCTFGNLIEKSILLIGTVICNYLQENSNQVILLDLECRLIYMHFRILCATSQQFYEIKNFLKNEMFYAFAMVLAAAIA